jgi:DNA-binding CsgD family transcriptional regulator
VAGPRLIVAVVEQDPVRRARVESALRAASLEPVDGDAADADVCVVGDLRSCAATNEAIPLVVVIPDKNPADVRRQFREGAVALVLDEDIESMLPAAVRAAAVGLSALPAGVRRWAENPSFSKREIQVMRLIVAGLTNAQIGRALYVSESTVKSHASSAFRKLGVRSRREAIRLLLDPDEGLTHVLARRGDSTRRERPAARRALIGQ